MIEIRGLAKSFGHLRVVTDVSFIARDGEITGLIGPNGAGKTTLLGLLAGVLRPHAGRVWYEARDVTRAPVHRRAQRGCVLTHQIARPFQNMTLAENVMVAAGARLTLYPWRALLAVNSRSARERAHTLLESFGIADAADKLANTVPLGYLKRMQVARALALEPRLLLLDEPLAGLNDLEAARFADQIVALNSAGITIVMVEHNLREITRIARRIAVLHAGAVLAEGPPREVMARADVLAAYLGDSPAGAVAHA
jgi:branched-chain amino acid transport system ATP-binding protein